MSAPRWYTVSELAEIYAKSPSSIRFQIKKILLKLSDAEKKIVLQKERGGPVGDRYHSEFVIKVFGPLPDQLVNAQRNVFGKTKLRVPIAGPSNENESPIMGIILSRMGAESFYHRIVTEMIEKEKGLRIRAVTGTDFFNSHRPTSAAFYERMDNQLDIPKVLLLYPFGRGAEVRSAAEGDKERSKSQLSRDAESTFRFIKEHQPDLRLDVKWLYDMPFSLLVWTERQALVEPYDLNHESGHPSCIGRKAPLLVIKRGTDYHQSLLQGFDYIFNQPEQVTHTKTFSLEEVETEYERNSNIGRGPKGLRTSSRKAVGKG